MQPKIISASIVGEKNTRYNKPCEDAWGVYQDELEWILVLADGAGSAPLASAGAALAVSFSIEWFKSSPKFRTGNNLSLLFEYVHEQMMEYSRDQNIDIRELSCTLQIATQTGDKYTLAKVGDGNMIVIAQDKVETPFPDPINGFVNHTHFITQADWRTHFQTASYEFLDCIFLQTDGVDPISILPESGNPYSPFYLALHLMLSKKSHEASEAVLCDLLNSQSIKKRSNDDKSLIVAITKPEIGTPDSQDDHISN